MGWFRIVNAGEKKARLDIYDAIGETTDWWTGEKTGIAASDFSATLQALGELDEIELHINSPGGLLHDGYQIYNELRRNPARVNGLIDGQAASAASVIAMACDTLTMPENATLWIHNPMAIWGAYLQGYSADMRDAANKFLRIADELDSDGETILNTYLRRAGAKADRASMKAMMDAETLITAERAVELGLADAIEDPISKTVNFDMAAIAAQQGPHLDAAVKAAVERAKPPAAPPPADPLPMDAKAVVGACRTAGFQALAPAMIAADMTPAAVRARLATAKAVNDRITAGGLQDQAAELLDLALTKPVADVMGHMIALKREQLDPEIDSHLPPGGPDPTEAKAPRVADIYAARRKAA